MEEVAELAGYFAAHAACIPAEHDTFDPTLTFIKANGGWRCSVSSPGSHVT